MMSMSSNNMPTNYEPKTCDNCGSTDGHNNSSGDFQCENCGYDEGENE